MTTYESSMHRWGRATLAISAALFIMYPLLCGIVFNAPPNLGVVARGLLAIAPIYWTVGVIEAFTFGPMLGTSAYLSFVTGNLTAIKVPVSILSLELTGFKANTAKGDAVSTIAVAVCSIVTTLMIAVGMLFISMLRPILASKLLAPAFANMIPALFGALGVIFIAKRVKVAIAPIILMTALFIFIPSLSGAVSLLVPVSAGFSVLVARILYKNNLLP